MASQRDDGRQSPSVAGTPGRGRDRDVAGKPRNARLRDGLGRPLPRSATEGTERVPDDLAVGPAEAAALGGSLLTEGRPFHAHEVFEAAWKTGPPAERELWQGLAQVAVGITHVRRGNPRGAVTLLRRGAERIRGYAADAGSGERSGAAANENAGGQAGPGSDGQRLYGIDLGFVIARAEDIAATVESDGLSAVPEADLLFPLSPPAS
ncbi:MAG TPA: DUF309 domain-containing protein [Trebonia sp.]